MKERLIENDRLIQLDNFEKIEPEVIENVLHLSDDDVKWLKISSAGFMDNADLLAEELYAVVVEIKPYWIRWEPGLPPQKLPFVNGESKPEGFEIRLDLKVQLASGELIGLSLAPSSARSYSRYLRRLQALKLSPDEVVTRMTCKAVSNKKNQKFTVLDFEYIPRKPELGDERKTNQNFRDPEEPPSPSDEDAPAKELDVVPF